MKLQILLLSAAFYTHVSYGQETLQDTSKRSSSLDEVIISANRGEETRRTIAQQIQLLSAKQIAVAQAQTTADLLSNTAGIFVQRSQMGGGSPVLRGFEASRILLVVDGVRLNNLIYRSGHLQNILSLDNNSLDRVEVLFGPSSTIYGSDALGGVIHLYTKKAAFAEAGTRLVNVNAFTRFGTANEEKSGHVDLNIGGQKLASFTSFTFSDFGDLRGGENQNPFYDRPYGERPFYVKRIHDKDSLVKNDDRYLQVGSAYSQYDILQKLAWRPTERLSHGLNLQFSNSSDIPRYDRLTDPDGAGLRFAEWYYGPQTRLLTAYDLNYTSPEGWISKMRSTISYQHITESRHQRRFNSNTLQNRKENVEVIGYNLDLLHVSSHHSLHLGADAQYSTVRSTADAENILTGERTALDTRYPAGDNTMNSAALYFSHTWRINPHLTLTDGFRAGYVGLKSQFGDTTFFKFPFDEVKQEHLVYSGSIGLIHIPNDDLKFSLMLGTGFRTPNVDDLAKVFESAPGSVIVPDESLKPEKTLNTEIGITKIYNGITTWENALYYTQFTDAIATEAFTYKGQDSILYDGVMSKVLSNQNKKRAYIYGFSSSFRTRLLEDVEVSFSMNYTYGRFKTDSSDVPMDHIPPFNMRLGLRYAHEKFSSDFFVNYHAWKKLKDYYLDGEDNEQYATPDGMPAWFTVNWRVSYEVHKLISLQAGVDNIFDTQYRTFASGINAPGRNVFGTLRFHL
ncbi:MAG: TonB-dependent receptor [Bacteroidia bacterium]|nr:TonB-dependent receptor [Bacteroidia bacterium]